MRHGFTSFAGVQAQRVLAYADLRTRPEALADGGWWAVVAEFDGPWHAWRFATVGADAPPARSAPRWHGPDAGHWRSSMTEEQYCAAVCTVREQIRAGQVYQANICRVLSAPLPVRPSARALAAVLSAGNPAPYAGVIDVPDGLTGADGRPVPSSWVVSASPELGLQVGAGQVRSGPIKGTGKTAADLQDKDRAENIMITDLVRNDLQHVCRPGTVAVTDLLAVEHHPGLVHLVSRVAGDLDAESLSADGAAGWSALLRAAHPPGSVSGAPKSSALAIIEQVERAPRGPYCGQIGWIDADTDRACLAVGIRTFWWSRGELRFGTGAGITYGSDPQAEWAETQLKAQNLLRLASTAGRAEPGVSGSGECADVAQ